MNKYIEELITEMYFDICDISYGSSYTDVGYDNKKAFFLMLKEKMEELQSRLEKETA